jgi:5'-3' exonuclease
MGIPSYFSYIIKNHSNIIRNLQYHQNVKQTVFDHIYLDCNSIIYDAVHLLEKEAIITDNSTFENTVIELVVENIKKYITFIKPTTTIYIAFDGVAPFAKMEQQRTRRWKSHFMTTVSFDDTKTVIPKWNTSAITPGTEFMNKLSYKIKHAFEYSNGGSFSAKNIHVTTSTEPGEGEHKMFDHLRKYCKKTDTVAVYGLDSDLIMLAIFHIHYCKNIHIFREAPEFAKSHIKVDNTSHKLPLFLNIDMLCSSIMTEMACKIDHRDRVYDYVFLCFFLGNDFLPHFPALNIRTNGIQILLDVYRMVIGNSNRYLVSMEKNRILWKNVGVLLKELAKLEYDTILNEYTLRDKWDGHYWEEKTADDREKKFTSVPVIYRAEEKYICPHEKFWENRYYSILFHEHRNEDTIKQISNNYLEGLEWVYKYYSRGCPDWRWKYNYHYPPLLVDLVNYVPHYDTDFILQNTNAPFSSFTQLSYVLPPEQLILLPDKIRDYLMIQHTELYNQKIKFQWAFCRYFWECHIVCPPIKMELLEKWDKLLLVL